MVFLVSGGLSEGARPFPLKIFDTKISVNSTSGECINFLSELGAPPHLRRETQSESQILNGKN